MAIVKWKASAFRLFNEHVDTALMDYGKKTAERWLTDADEIFSRLQKFPESYTPEPLLRGKKRKYRSCRMMGGRFRLIYYYNPSTNIESYQSRMSVGFTPRYFCTYRVK